jgi:putative phosphoesterase
MADSHDNVPMIKRAVELFNAEGVALVIHAGDFVAPFAVKELAGLQCRVVAVFGNNDGERIGVAKRFEACGEVHPRLAEVEIGGRKIGVVHENELVAPLAAGGVYDVVVYGHTHEIDVRREKSLIINPGEAGGWLTGKCTVALLEVETLEVEIRELQ